MIFDSFNKNFNYFNKFPIRIVGNMMFQILVHTKPVKPISASCIGNRTRKKLGFARVKHQNVRFSSDMLPPFAVGRVVIVHLYLHN